MSTSISKTTSGDEPHRFNQSRSSFIAAWVACGYDLFPFEVRIYIGHKDSETATNAIATLSIWCPPTKSSHTHINFF